jgi:DNA-binding PadR family transcriptional regulator
MARRLSLATVTVLHAVARGVAHGFDIVAETGLRGGTVYPILSRLESDGFLSSSWEPAEVARADGRPPRRYYKVTRTGLKTLNDALEGLKVLRPLGAAKHASSKGQS